MALCEICSGQFSTAVDNLPERRRFSLRGGTGRFLPRVWMTLEQPIALVWGLAHNAKYM